MHGGLVVFDLDDIVSTEFFDHDVGRFFLVMHGVEGEGGSVHGRHLAQESLGGGDLVGFVGGSDLGNRLSALISTAATRCKALAGSLSVPLRVLPSTAISRGKRPSGEAINWVRI